MSRSPLGRDRFIWPHRNLAPPKAVATVPFPPYNEVMNPSKIPHTDSIEELARFWDQHDLAEFEDELEEVREPVFEREAVVKVHLPCKDAEALRELAQSQGVNDADLVRQWVLERVHTP
jgi:hypothetical protein